MRTYYNYYYKSMSKKRSQPNNQKTNQNNKSKASIQASPTPPQRISDSFESSPKKVEEMPDQRVRILQDNLVFVNALPPEASSKETLMDELHFLRYGSVSKLILNPPYPNKKGVTYQAYVTYDNHLDASLAIALDGYKLSDRPLKVSFGTTKYCSHFIRGNSCPNPDCFYLHKVDKQRQVSNGDTRTIFKQQNAKAMSNLIQNLQELAGRVLDSEGQEIEDGFPSITETLDYLVDQQEVKQSEIEKAFVRAKAKRQASLQVPKESMRVQSVAPSKDREREKQHKLVKSNSHSTMCTPTKPDDFIVTSKREDKIEVTKPEARAQKQSYKQRQKQKETKDGKDINKQNTFGSRQLKLQQKIEKLIIRQIWKKNNNQCRSRFVKGVTASREECSRLRGIVQKYLIAHN